MYKDCAHMPEHSCTIKPCTYNIHTHIHIYMYKDCAHMPEHFLARIHTHTHTCTHRRPARHPGTLRRSKTIYIQHTYIHTHIHTYTHTYTYTRLHTGVPPAIRALFGAVKPFTYNIHTYTLTYIHTYIHTHTVTHRRPARHPGTLRRSKTIFAQRNGSKVQFRGRVSPDRVIFRTLVYADAMGWTCTMGPEGVCGYELFERG